MWSQSLPVDFNLDIPQPSRLNCKSRRFAPDVWSPGLFLAFWPFWAARRSYAEFPELRKQPFINLSGSSAFSPQATGLHSAQLPDLEVYARKLGILSLATDHRSISRYYIKMTANLWIPTVFSQSEATRQLYGEWLCSSLTFTSRIWKPRVEWPRWLRNFFFSSVRPLDIKSALSTGFEAL